MLHATVTRAKKRDPSAISSGVAARSKSRDHARKRGSSFAGQSVRLECAERVILAQADRVQIVVRIVGWPLTGVLTVPTGWVCLGGCVKLCLGGCVKLVWVDQALFLVLKPTTQSRLYPRQSLTLYPRPVPPPGRPQGQPDRAAAFRPRESQPPPPHRVTDQTGNTVAGRRAAGIGGSTRAPWAS